MTVECFRPENIKAVLKDDKLAGLVSFIIF